ncbi:MAG: sigma-70 family RNA polymerase sigma factor [Cyanobacteria bacterium SBLK]|nr:sigma-70 family RNA polymerase sigma factor [Cyanobacteria bacterium SBLK]
MIANLSDNRYDRDRVLTSSDREEIVSEFWQQWQEHRDSLYWCCFKLMNSNPIDAEDALSQAMVKAREKVEMQQFRGQITNFKAWLMRLTRNLCIDILRKRHQGGTKIESIEWMNAKENIDIARLIESPERALEKEERLIEIRRAIANLPERLRETFILHFYEERSHREIAACQGISYDNTCKRISQARQLLKETLKVYFLE